MKKIFAGPSQWIAISALLLGFTFFFPLWEISLSAPQYPEGLALQIWSSKLTGDITTINILNHYIGMAKISEENFPELKFFPYLFGALMGLGLLVAILKKKFLQNLWVLGLLAFASWAFYDFWEWEYRFGHDLNPDAAIKMEDMVYQPPLFGYKTFLNIEAASFPKIAGYAFTLSVLIAVAALVFNFAKKKSKSALGTGLIAGLMLFLVQGCTRTGPETIVLNKDQCDYCKMVITDKRFGGEWITAKGKVYKFDSIECLARHIHTAKSRDEKGIAFVRDSANPTKWVQADKAMFAQVEGVHSPMGEGLLSSESLSTIETKFGKPSKSWNWEETISQFGAPK